MNDRSVIGLIIFSVIVFVMLAIYGAFASERQWNQFAKINQCKEIGSITASSSLGVGIGTNGSVSVVPVFVPGKTGYQCNDGKQYWR